jgi:CHASE3 domain sensor protein
LIGLSAYLTFRSQNALLNSVAVLDRGYDVRERIRQVYGSLVDAETGQRGFLLTSDEAYLDPYKGALERLPGQLDQLSLVMANEPEQQKCLVELRALIKDKLDELGLTIRYAKAGDMAAAIKLVKSDQGKVDMDRMGMLVGQMSSNSDRALVADEHSYLQGSRANTRLAMMLVLANGVFFALAAVLFWRIRRMESLVTICAWSRTIEYQGSWMSFEDYLKLRFGLSSTHGISPAETERLAKSLEAAAKRQVAPLPGP